MKLTGFYKDPGPPSPEALVGASIFGPPDLCPECGATVEVGRVLSWDGVDCTLGRVEPCGHEVAWETIGRVQDSRS